ncbi:uncharacterized protein LOC130896830 [Diorhabda carinulata]|uniref:uncharacterized protein LOC130896830 n=1 Tax=Diorhabda carinulata TaxID=1163345 RepID=UPI0025A27DD4|nr:uncharacterized protein LOC130896830 [Diorhabda carinulata]
MPAMYQPSFTINISEVEQDRIDLNVELSSKQNYDKSFKKKTVVEVLDISSAQICCWNKISKQNEETNGFSYEDCECYNTMNTIVNKKEAQLQEYITTKVLPTMNFKGKNRIEKAKMRRLRSKEILSNFQQSERQVTSVLVQDCAKSLNVRIAKSPAIERLLERMYLSLPKNGLKNNFKNNLSLMINREEIFELFIIKNDVQFTDKIVYKKPLLLLNKYNFSSIEYETESLKANIVFPVNKVGCLLKEILKNPQVFLAVIKGYVKLVKSSILYSYLNDENVYV